jgi:hypothetical protein
MSEEDEDTGSPGLNPEEKRLLKKEQKLKRIERLK